MPDVWDAYRALGDALAAAEEPVIEGIFAQGMTLQDVADAYGMNLSAVGMIRARDKRFPKPVRRFGRADVFWGPDVDKFMLNRGATRCT